MAESVLRGAELEERREAEAEFAAAQEGEPIAEPLAALPEDKPFSSLVPAIIGAAMLMQTLSATVGVLRDAIGRGRLSQCEPPSLFATKLRTLPGVCASQLVQKKLFRE